MILDRRGYAKDRVTFSIRVRPEVKKLLEEKAYKDRRTLGKTVELIIEESIGWVDPTINNEHPTK